MGEDRADASRHTGAALRRQMEAILLGWEEAVRARVPVAQGWSHVALRGRMPGLLDIIASALEAGWRHERSEAQTAQEHARQRFDLGADSYGQLASEYGELRRAILSHFGGDPDCTAAALRLLHDAVDASIAHASEMLTQLQLERAQHRGEFELRRLRGRLEGLEDVLNRCHAHEQAMQEELTQRSKDVALFGHDMRVPLSTALLTAQTVQAGQGETSLTTSRAARIVRSIERVDEMVTSLLDADRLRHSPRRSLHATSCDLRAIIEEACQDLGDAHARALVAQLPQQLMAYADAGALKRVIENLLSNAIKHGRGAQATIRLKQEGTEAVISVRNDGEPIEAQLLARLFEARFRAAHADREGWGLGLASVKSVAEAHGGNVAVTSTRESGTTFYVRIPLDFRATSVGASAP